MTEQSEKELALREIARHIGPLTVDRAGYVWGRSEKGGRTVFFNVRGWGYLTGQGHGALGLSEAEGIDRQNAWGEMLCAAVNAFAEPDFKAVQSEHGTRTGEKPNG